MDNTFDSDTTCQIYLSNAVKSVKAITEALFQGRDLDSIRIAIADLMELQLKRGKDADNQAALPYFINALGSLSINIDKKHQLSSVGLYPCLIDLENAVAVLDGNHLKHMLVIDGMEKLSYTFLIEALATIRQSWTIQEKNNELKTDNQTAPNLQHKRTGF